MSYLPNYSLAVEAMLAVVRIRAVWSSTSPDFGVSVSWLSLIYLVDLPILTLAFAIPTVLMLKFHSFLYTHCM